MENSLFAIDIPIPTIQPSEGTISAGTIIKHLNNEGALLLRGFGFDSKNFEEFTKTLCNNFHVVGTRQKTLVNGDKYSTQVKAKDYALLGHTEGSYRPNNNPPEICFFLCIAPPVEKGGETTLADGEEYLKLLPEEIRKRFKNEGVTYEMYWEKERWQDEFSVNDLESLKQLLDNIKGIRYSLNNEDLHLFYTTKTITRSRSGREVFATAILAHLPEVTHPEYHGRVYTKPSNRVYFGNGEIIPNETVNILIDIYDKIAYKHRWQENDLLVIDNTRYLHGRALLQKDCDRLLISRFGRLKSHY